LRVLVVKMSSLGDVIHTLPALSDASKALPGIRFDWAVEEAFAEIPGWHPAVDRVIPVALRRWRKRPLRDFRGPEWRQARSALRRQRYDAVIDAQGLMKSAFIASLVKAPRYGMDRHSVRERLAASFYHHKIPVPRELHAVERVRLLFARALDYQLPAGPAEYGLRENLPANDKGLVPGLLFFHGTARAEKLWPEAQWVELADLAMRQGYAIWLPWGSEQERERAERIVHGCASGHAAKAQVLPRLDLLGLANMLLEVSGAVAVDTGLGHLCAALDVPTVSLYGPTDTSLIGACGRHQVHIQSPVGPANTADPLAMMQSITASAVWRELQAIVPGINQAGRAQPETER
jgi:lipopolysaccharide heptosyltransferase I